MANEFAHVTVGTELTQAEFEGTTLHQFSSQATGDLAYASSSTQISRLGIGSTGDTLTIAAGVPAWNTAVQSDVTSSRAINGTVYQNTSGRPLIITVTIDCTGDDYDRAVAYCDSNASPTTVVTAVGHLVGNGEREYLSMTFVAVPSYYYKVTSAAGTPTLVDWFEWEI